LTITEDLPRPIQPDPPLGYQLLGHLVYHITCGPGGDGHLTGVELHVAALDALGGQGPECGQVLG